MKTPTFRHDNYQTVCFSLYKVPGRRIHISDNLTLSNIYLSKPSWWIREEWSLWILEINTKSMKPIWLKSANIIRYAFPNIWQNPIIGRVQMEAWSSNENVPCKIALGLLCITNVNLFDRAPSWSYLLLAVQVHTTHCRFYWELHWAPHLIWPLRSLIKIFVDFLKMYS
jgi:hypothetical protein